MNQLTKQNPCNSSALCANKHINSSNKHINMDGDKSLGVDVVHMGITSTMLAKSIYGSFRDRGIELYLLIVPLMLVALFL